MIALELKHEEEQQRYEQVRAFHVPAFERERIQNLDEFTRCDACGSRTNTGNPCSACLVRILDPAEVAELIRELEADSRRRRLSAKGGVA